MKSVLSIKNYPVVLDEVIAQLGYVAVLSKGDFIVEIAFFKVQI